MTRKEISGLILVSSIAALAWLSFDDPLLQRAAFLCVLCLGLWLTEFIPLYATSFVLIVSIPLMLSSFNTEFSFNKVLLWPVNPVLALFFGGFALSVAGKKYGIDAYMARLMLHLSRGKPNRLVLLILTGTAILSMWMSNIAACAMMLVALRPVWKQGLSPPHRKAALLAVAFGANFGGMATPIGTGPNAIAMAVVQSNTTISFFEWMCFALPLTIVMLSLTFLLLKVIYSIRGSFELPTISITQPTRRTYAVVAIFFLAVSLWLLEPAHHIPAALIAILIAAILFGSRLLVSSDLAEIDWPTLMLIAGGLTFGELIDRSGLARSIASFIQWSSIPRYGMIFILVFSASFLSAIASNTAATILMIQLGNRIDPSPDLAILIAIGASLGAPFIISTPPNAMVYGEGGLVPKDFLIPGLILMLFGCLLVALTGPAVLAFVGFG